MMKMSRWIDKSVAKKINLKTLLKIIVDVKVVEKYSSVVLTNCGS